MTYYTHFEMQADDWLAGCDVRTPSTAPLYRLLQYIIDIIKQNNNIYLYIYLFYKKNKKKLNYYYFVFNIYIVCYNVMVLVKICK